MVPCVMRVGGASDASRWLPCREWLSIWWRLLWAETGRSMGGMLSWKLCSSVPWRATVSFLQVEKEDMIKKNKDINLFSRKKWWLLWFTCHLECAAGCHDNWLCCEHCWLYFWWRRGGPGVPLMACQGHQWQLSLSRMRAWTSPKGRRTMVCLLLCICFLVIVLTYMQMFSCFKCKRFGLFFITQIKIGWIIYLTQTLV